MRYTRRKPKRAVPQIRETMRTSDFDYHLPDDLIAQTPAEPRDSSRLMVVDRGGARALGHDVFRNLPGYLRAGDLLAFNDSRVFPARLHGRSAASGGKVELLLLSPSPDGGGRWRALAKPGRRMREGAEFVIGGDDGDGADGGVRGVVVAREDSGARVVRFEDDSRLREAGIAPLPPYIKAKPDDPERYQTVYAKTEGSVAAPTAGLHFTRVLMDALGEMGVETAFVTLHVGWDSFNPVRSENPAEHRMHSEYWEISEIAARAVSAAKADGRRVISVGTTAARLLENAAAEDGSLASGSGWVDLFITPGYQFRAIDGLITNFHLPKSTLLMLVSAFAGRENILAAYRRAARERYRFYSFGDAMLIL